MVRARSPDQVSLQRVPQAKVSRNQHMVRLNSNDKTHILPWWRSCRVWTSDIALLQGIAEYSVEKRKPPCWTIFFIHPYFLSSKILTQANLVPQKRVRIRKIWDDQRELGWGHNPRWSCSFMQLRGGILWKIVLLSKLFETFLNFISQ